MSRKPRAPREARALRKPRKPRPVEIIDGDEDRPNRPISVLVAIAKGEIPEPSDLSKADRILIDNYRS